MLRDDVPSANGITVHRGRLFIGECRAGGRLLELDLDGGAPRVILENVPSPNAMEFGPDGLAVLPGDGRQRDLADRRCDGGEPERVAGDLGVPDSVKFDAHGFIVSTQVFSGQVLRINPRNGEQHRAGPADPRPGQLHLRRWQVVRLQLHRRDHRDPRQRRDPIGAAGRTELAAGSRRGRRRPVYIADGTFFYSIAPDGTRQIAGMLFTPGYPGFLRGLAPSGPGEFVVTTANGDVSLYRPGDQRNRSSGSRIRPALWCGTSLPTDPPWSSSRAPGGCWRSDPA